MTSILRHKPSNTLIIRRGGFVDKPAYFDGNLIAGPGANFWGPLRVSGNLAMGKNVTVDGSILAGEAVVGPECRVNGSLNVKGDLTILDGAHIQGGVSCEGNLLLRPGVATPSAYADGVIEVMGSLEAGEVRAGKKVIARRQD